MANFQQQIREDITRRIVDALKAGKPPWRKPWTTSENCGVPRNIVSKKMYRGVNPLLLEMASTDHDFVSCWWATIKQWNQLGASVMPRPKDVRPGEWGTKIVYYSTFEKEVEGDGGKPEKKKFPILRTFTVFNIDQVKGADEKLAKFRAPKPDPDDTTPIPVSFERAEQIVKATKAKIRHRGDKAFYTRPAPADSWPKHKKGDTITMPPRSAFKLPTDYYDVLFHELGHWTEVRLDWKGTYAMGELVAEIAACYLAREAKVPNFDDLDEYEKYLAMWLKAVDDDPKFIWNASQQASKATDYIMDMFYAEHPDAVLVADEAPKAKASKPRKTRKKKTKKKVA